MTGLLEEALRRIEILPADRQDEVASEIIANLEDEEAWTQRLGSGPNILRSLANEAAEEHRRGLTKPLDELIG